MASLSLDKYEALGNDFLVLVDLDARTTITPALARELCDRHRGVGADGLIRVAPEADGHFAMALLNADGTVAETSGNGLRCAALALVRAGLAEGHCTLESLAGPARCEIGPVVAGRSEVRVAMGEVRSAPTESPIATRAAWRVDVGNPHLVLIGAAGDVAITEVGAALEWAVPTGQNVELVSVVDRAHLALEVWERGAGLTEACGSGSVAAAGAAAKAGLVDRRVVVANPGGTLVVELDGAEPPRATLTGPARHVAALVVEERELEGERR